LKTAYTPFVEESGDDYGLGAAECEEHGNPVQTALAGEDLSQFDIGSTLQDFAQSAMAGEEKCGCDTYGCNYDDVADCQSEIFGNLNYRTLPYSGNRKEGAVPLEFLRETRIGCLRIVTLVGNASLPTKSETKRAGLRLKAIESTDIKPGQRRSLTIGLRLQSFDGALI
jgi:hypothetical protein